jgi:putative SOS response-associated peptidase YedK
VVRPTDPALAITAQGPRILRFGLKVTWQKPPLINARSETVAQRSAFRPLLGHRCLVPASAWIEWQDVGAGKKKQMWRLKPAAAEPFALAGLVGDESFVLLTCAPAPAIAFIHDRMPVVLAADWEEVWLDSRAAFADLAGALGPCDRTIETIPVTIEPVP